jgi:tyrosyl-tRNA synthetase
MRYTFSPEFAVAFPAFIRFVVVARGIDNTGEHPALKQMLDQAAQAVRTNPALADAAAHPQIAPWRAAMRAFGADPDETLPSVLSLVTRARRALDAGETLIPYHNPMVAISNYVSLAHLVPSGTDDLGMVHGDIGLRLAKGNELFVGFASNRVERPAAGEVIFADKRKVMCRRWVWQQGVHTMATPESRDVTVNIDILPPLTRQDGQRIADELAGLVRRFCDGQTEVYALEAERPVIEFATPPFTLQETVYDTLELRGYVEQSDDRAAVRRLLGEGTTIYEGFDPTKASLHIGHFLSLLVFHYLQEAGNRMIFILGGGTAQVGDPSLRSVSRKMLSTTEVAQNAVAMKAQVQGMGLVNFDADQAAPGKPAAMMLDNVNWLQMDLLEFAREVTPHYSVNQLVKREDFRNRLEGSTPLSLFEFIYTALQGYDYLHLNDEFACRVQMGGNDQWLNIREGADLIRSKYQEAKNRAENGVELTAVETARLQRGGDAYSLTFPLLLDSTGAKMGKTTTGQAVWLAAEGPSSTTPFDFYQYWLNCPDADLERNFRLFTFLSLDEIDAIVAAGNPRAAQHRLAYEVTKIVHGEQTARRVQEDAERAFKGGGLPQNVPTYTLTQAEAEAGVPLTAILAAVGVESKGQARRLIEQGGIMLNEQRLSAADVRRTIGLADLRDFDGVKAAVIRMGKGKVAKICIE